MKISGIYKITNIKNMQFYVGRSTNVTRRLKQHLWDLRANRHHNPKLQNSFNKYGESFFTFTICCEATLDESIEMEQLAIDEGDQSGRCFNINTNAEHGGVVGRVWTAEQIANIKAGQEKSAAFQKTSLKNQSAEQRKIALEKACSAESREKAWITRNMHGNGIDDLFKQYREKSQNEAVDRTFLAIEWVIETRESMSVANKRFKINQRMWSKVIPLWEEQTGKVFDLPSKASGAKNGRFAGKVVSPFGEYPSITVASNETGIPSQTIARWCRHKTGGWSYSKDEPLYSIITETT